MSTHPLVEGLVIPTLTPFTSDQHLNEDLTERLAWHYAELGVPGLFPGGTTGEFALLTPRERQQLLEATLRGIRRSNHQMKVIAHTGGVTLDEVLTLNHHAHEQGVDAVAVVTPYYYGYEEAELLQYYKQLLQALPELKVYAYTIPQRAGNTISVQSVQELMTEPNFAGIKDSTGDMYRLLDLIDLPNLSVLAGADDLALPFMWSGGDGLVSGPGGIIPEVFLAFFAAVKQQDLEKSRQLAGLIRDFSQLIRRGGRIDFLRAALDWRLGQASLGPSRFPLPNLSAEERRSLERALDGFRERTEKAGMRLSPWNL